ncbi:hypothetical protein C8R46DRAFT_1031432 [Mycena filopes]|nr:hypothetical protein C8R46DRAFT_1031432 [Mycena filopes]
MAPVPLGIVGEVLRIIVEPNTFVAIAGTSLGGSMKRQITITKDGKDYLLGGDGKILEVDGVATKKCLTFPPAAARTSLFLVFQAAPRTSDDYIDSAIHPDYKENKHIIDGYATYYTSRLNVRLQFRVEDGGDNDYKDCTLSVALIA